MRIMIFLGLGVELNNDTMPEFAGLSAVWFGLLVGCVVSTVHASDLIATSNSTYGCSARSLGLPKRLPLYPSCNSLHSHLPTNYPALDYLIPVPVHIDPYPRLNGTWMVRRMVLVPRIHR